MTDWFRICRKDKPGVSIGPYHTESGEWYEDVRREFCSDPDSDDYWEFNSRHWPVPREDLFEHVMGMFYSYRDSLYYGFADLESLWNWFGPGLNTLYANGHTIRKFRTPEIFPGHRQAVALRKDLRKVEDLSLFAARELEQLKMRIWTREVNNHDTVQEYNGALAKSDARRAMYDSEQPVDVFYVDPRRADAGKPVERWSFGPRGGIKSVKFR